MRRRIAFTLMELTLAMVITTIIGLSVAAATMVLSRAYANGENYADCVQNGRIAMQRIRRTVVRAKLVLQADNNNLMVWRQDANGDGQINLSEITQFYVDAAARQLKMRQVVFPSSLSDVMRGVLDAPVPLQTALTSTSFFGNYGGAYTQDSPLAEDVDYLHVTTDEDPPYALFVQLEGRFVGGTQQLTLNNAAALRADRTAYVGSSDDGYVLLDDAQED